MPIQKNNEDIRDIARKKGVAFWRIAREIGVSETTVIRWLRLELTPEKKERILEALDKVAAQLYGERS